MKNYWQLFTSIIRELLAVNDKYIQRTIPNSPAYSNVGYVTIIIIPTTIILEQLRA